MVSRIARATLPLLALTAATGGANAAVRADDCADLLPGSEAAAPGPRRLEPEDLVRLRDIGPADIVPLEAHLIALSPDHRRIAFELIRADLARNDYCRALVVMPLGARARPLIVDRDGSIVRVSFDFRGKAAFPTGTAQVITPRWFPDSRRIAFLKRVEGVTRVWTAAADGSGSMPLTPAGIEVEDFRITADGSRIVYSTRPGLAAARVAIAQEAARGFHYDDRYAPVAGSRPFPALPIPHVYFALDVASGQARPADAGETALLLDARHIAQIDAPAWIESDAGGRSRLMVHDAGRTRACTRAPCDEWASRPWLAGPGQVRFLHREGWAHELTALYEWSLASGRLRRLYATRDKLADCVGLGPDLLCLREGSTTPRRLELLEPGRGRRTLLFDPNPEFAALRLGEVRRMEWRNDLGAETIGDLVLPVGYQPGRRYPLIVVQYDTRGFLRGGTGDEYPIQAFAARGFAVLSLSRPLSPARQALAQSARESGRLNLAGFADRRNALSSIETGVRRLIAEGIADPTHIGITGMSDGATSTVFALLHSRLFAAAAMSTCCIDTMLPTRVGPAAARYFASVGYPRITDDGTAFWRELSLSRNAARVSTPILLQLADDEYMSALESYTALRERDQPIDMFVFPDEHHVKYQPVHRLAVYRRALDWFDYWLQNRRSSDPARQIELVHWDELHGSMGGRAQNGSRGGLQPDQ